MNKLFPSALWLLTIATFVLLCAPAPCDNCLTCAGSFCLVCTGTRKYFDYYGCQECSYLPTSEYWLYYEQCYTCSSTEYLNAAFVCSPCTNISPQCLACAYVPADGVAKCSLCQSGYYSVQSNCLSCRATITNCLKCDVGPECNTCDPGYGLISSLN